MLQGLDQRAIRPSGAPWKGSPRAPWPSSAARRWTTRGGQGVRAARARVRGASGTRGSPRAGGSGNLYIKR